MADHLKIPELLPLTSKRIRNQYDPDAPPVDRESRATTLRGVLEGLESTNAFPPDGMDEDEDSPLGDIVIKFTGAQPFANTAFKGLGLTPLAVTDDKRYFALTDSEARVALSRLLHRFIDTSDGLGDVTASLRDELGKIEGIELYGREDRVAPDLSAPVGDETIVVDVSLWPTSLEKRSDIRRGEARVAEVAGLLERMASADERIAVLAADDRDPDRLVIHARVDARAFNVLAEHELVEKLRGPLTARVTQTDLDESIGQYPAEVPLPEGQPIGIIDDLVSESNPWMEGVVVEQRQFPSETALGDATMHGTQVASIAAWGDVHRLLSDPTNMQPFPLYVARVAQADVNFDAQVFGNPSEQIESALEWLASKDVKVVVIALGTGHADLGPITSDISSTVDAQAKKHGMVVITSAGNIVHGSASELLDYPNYLSADESKVAAPGTAALALTVTSVAIEDTIDRVRRPHAIAVAAANEHSPFGRTGPVRSARALGRQKPEFAAHGGNLAVDQATGNIVSDAAEISVVTLIPPINGRLFAAATGTSLAAPRVAHEVAKLATRYPDASANLLRALTALSGGHRPRRGDPTPPFHSSAYGIPSADSVMESGANQVFFTFDGEMATNSHSVIQLPIPELFATGASTREIRIALAFDPPVRRSRKDYIAGRMEFAFIQREDLEDIKAAFKRQPTAKERAENPKLQSVESLAGRQLHPSKTTFFSDTLMRRSYFSPSGGWDPNDEDYFLVMTHEHSRWTAPQKRGYATQKFAVAVEIIDYDRLDIDLYAAAEAKLTGRATAQSGGSTRGS